MVSQKLLADICEDVGHIYQMTCEQSSQTVIASNLFKETADKIKAEHPDLNDVEILSMMLRVYSDVIRSQ